MLKHVEQFESVAVAYLKLAMLLTLVTVFLTACWRL